MNKYLLTGAAGHLGLTLIKKLVDDNKKVRALVLPNDQDEKYLPKGIEIVHGDITNKESLKDFFKNEDNDDLIVIHCAGIVSIASAASQKLYDVNVNGTQNIIELSLENKVKKLIYISSVHAIKEEPNKGVIKETLDFDPEYVVGAYAKLKAIATKNVLKAAEAGLDVNVIHPSGIIGPNDYGRSHTNQIFIDFYKGKLTAGIEGGYDFVDVRDVAEGIMLVIEKGQKGETYILSNNYFTVKELLEISHEITGKRRIKVFLPRWFVKLTAPFSELYYRIKRQPPLYTTYSIYTLSSNSNFSHAKATEKLGYKTRPIAETIKDTINWLLKTKQM